MKITVNLIKLILLKSIQMNFDREGVEFDCIWVLEKDVRIRLELISNKLW